MALTNDFQPAHGKPEKQVTTAYKLADALYGPIYRASLRGAEEPAVARKLVDLMHAREARSKFQEADDPFQERRAAESIHKHGGHHNIIKYHCVEVANQGKTMVFTMEYCPHGDLWMFLTHHMQRAENEQTRELPRKSVVPERQALRLFSQIVSGVRFLHEIDIAHRDLSLENVLLGEGQVCKVIDFGLSTRASKMCRGRVGKHYYMAPEVVNSNNSLYDPRQADVWSLGIMLFMLLTGSPLCELASACNSTLHFVAQPDGLSRLLNLWSIQLSYACVDLLQRMLQVDPVRRATLLEVQHHLALAWAKS